MTGILGAIRPRDGAVHDGTYREGASARADVAGHATKLPPLRLAMLLLGLVLGVLLPSLAIGIVATHRIITEERDAAEERLSSTAQSLALAVGREIAGQIDALAVFAASPAFGPDPAAPDLPVLEASARRVAHLLGVPIIVYTRDGTRLVNTRLPPGAAAPRVTSQDLIERVFATGRPAVGNLVTGALSGQPIVMLSVPVLGQDGEVVLAARAVLGAEHLHQLLAGERLPDGVFAGLTDANGMLVARSDSDHAALISQPVPDAALQKFRAAEAGVYRHRARDGVTRVFSFQAVPSVPGWTMVVAQPAKALDAPSRRSLLVLGLGGGGTVALALVLVLLAARRILRPLRHLRDHAWAIAVSGGEILPPGAGALPRARVAELEALRRGFAAAERALQRRAEAARLASSALAVREAELRALFEASPVGMLRANMDGQVREANDVFLRLLGLTREQVAAGLVRWDDLTSPGSQAANERAMVEARADPHGRCIPYEKTYIRADGSSVPVLVAFALVDHERGDTAAFVVDLTEVRHGEARLAESEARLRDVLGAVADAILVADENGKVVSVNPAAVRMFGHADEAGMAGLNLTELMPWIDTYRARPQQIAQRSGGEDGSASVPGWELTGRRRNGEEFPLELSVSSFESGARHFFTGVLRDATGRKRAETRLRESEARWRTLAEALPQLVWTCGADGRFDYLNRQWETYTGVPTERHLGYGWLEALHPDDRQPLRAAWKEAVRGREVFDAEARLRGADGSYRWFKKRAQPLFEPGSAEAHWFGTSTDISDLVAAREARAREAQELEQLVELRTRELHDSETRLAQAAKMEALGRMAGGVAHDFNNVLQAVQGGVSLAMRRLVTNPERALSYLELTTKAIDRGAAVTGRLLAFARRGELSAAEVAPLEVLEGVVELLRPALGPRLSLQIEAAPDVPALFVDSVQLETVLVNLANNARDALGDDGGTIRFVAEPATASGRAPMGLATQHYVRLAVEDDGVGMTPEVLARVTEPFFTTKPTGKGTGLGLAMARGFAEQSGGALTIDSAPGQGTRVSLWLPLATEVMPASEPDGAAQGEAGPQPKGRVLLVDDDPMVRMVLVAMLREQGYEVTEADGPAVALDLVDAGLAMDVLVTDLSMPGDLDGVGLVHAVRRHRGGLPSVLLTGHPGDAPDGTLAKAVDGPFAVLGKPVAAEALESRIAMVLGRQGTA